MLASSAVRQLTIHRVARLLAIGVRVHMIQLTRSFFDMLGVTLWPLLYATIAVYLYGADTSDQGLIAISLGATVMAIWSSVVTSASGALEMQRWAGTLELLVVAPPPFLLVLAPIVLATAAIGLYALVATFAWGWLIFDVSLSIAQPLWFAVAVPVAIAGIAALGMVLASLLVLTRAGIYIGNSLEYPGWLASGLLVPIALLPTWVEPISWALPPTWGMTALRAAATGGDPRADLLMCMVLAVVYVALSLLGLRVFETVARRRATLALS